MAWNVVAPVLAVALLWAGQPWWVALGVIVSAHALWLVPTLIPACGWCGRVVTRMADLREGGMEGWKDGRLEDWKGGGVEGWGGGEVWLTIDDGPHPEDTPRLLDLLEAHGARATFFFIGRLAEAHPELVREVVRRGHGVGNHTMNHVQYWFWAFGPRGVEREIEDCQHVLTGLTGSAPVWFRAPAGLKNPFVQEHLERRGLGLAGWSARGLDGVETNLEKVLGRLYAQVKPGSIILMHEGRVADNGQRLAPQVLEGLLLWLKEQGLRCVVPGV